MELIIVIALVLVGLALLLAEFLFVPGTTLVGLLGLGLSILGVFFAYDYFGGLVGTATLGLSLIVATTAGYYGLSSKTWDRFALHDSLGSDNEKEKVLLLEVGQIGRTLSALRPFGTAEFEGDNYEVRTRGAFLPSGTTVRIIKIDGKRIYVESTITLS